MAACCIDIRGFTAVTPDAESDGAIEIILYLLFDSINDALAAARRNVRGNSGFSKKLYAATNPSLTKPLGDGALLVWDYPQDTVADIGLDLFLLDFGAYCQAKFYEKLNECPDRRIRVKRAKLKLGLAITKGLAWKLGNLGCKLDYIGSVINRAARLQERARPHGIIIDFEVGQDFLMERICLEQNCTIKKLDLKGFESKITPVWMVIKCTDGGERPPDTEMISWRVPRNGDLAENILGLSQLYDWRISDDERPLSEQDTLSYFAMRAELEATCASDLASRVAAGHKVEKVLAFLLKTINGMEALMELPDREAPSWKEDWRKFGSWFHSAIAYFSSKGDGPKRRNLIEFAYRSTKPVYDLHNIDPALTIVQHKRIYQLICKGDVKQSRREMKQHISGHYKKSVAGLEGSENSTIEAMTRFSADTIPSIARRGISLITDPALKMALDSAYRSPIGIKTAKLAHSAFATLMSRWWPKDILCRFLSGWHSMHGTALYVSGLMIRMQREAARADEPIRSLLYKAASEIGEIIPEDTGVDDVPHNERFRIFANRLVGDNDWQRDRYAMPACGRFRDYVKAQRLSQSIEDGILTTAASENWNSGEYTFLKSHVTLWMTDHLRISPSDAAEAAGYINVHAGDTELGHFIHAIDGWQLFNQAKGEKPDPAKARQRLEEYLFWVGEAFDELHSVLR